jgi:hypothetical protein
LVYQREPDSGAFSSENVVQLVTASLVWLLIPWGIEVIFAFKSSAFCTGAVEMSQKSFMKCKYLSQDHSELVETLDPRPLKILYIAKKSQHSICDWLEVGFELHVAGVTNKLPSTEALAPAASVFKSF